MSVHGFEDILNDPFAQYLQLSAKIGGDVAQQADFVKKAFKAQLEFIKLASTSSQPAQAQLATLLKPTSDQISAIQEYREKHRTSPFFNHLSAISESIPALGWVCVAPTPGPHVKEMNDAGQFYTNRVLKEWKEKNATHVEWARSWVSTLTELQKYIKQHHTTGLVWSGKSAPPNGPAGGAPPPPPPVLPPVGDLSLGAGGEDDGRSALFAQINQGEDITKSLKRVTADMQTHKNPGLRTGPAPFKAPTEMSCENTKLITEAFIQTLKNLEREYDFPVTFVQQNENLIIGCLSLAMKEFIPDSNGKYIQKSTEISQKVENVPMTKKTSDHSIQQLLSSSSTSNHSAYVSTIAHQPTLSEHSSYVENPTTSAYSVSKKRTQDSSQKSKFDGPHRLQSSANGPLSTDIVNLCSSDEDGPMEKKHKEDHNEKSKEGEQRGSVLRFVSNQLYVPSSKVIEDSQIPDDDD